MTHGKVIKAIGIILILFGGCSLAILLNYIDWQLSILFCSVFSIGLGIALAVNTESSKQDDADSYSGKLTGPHNDWRSKFLKMELEYNRQELRRILQSMGQEIQSYNEEIPALPAHQERLIASAGDTTNQLKP